MIDSNFPGGNIIVDAIEGDTVSLHQDLRDTQGDWFYWCFRVRGAEGRILDFKFTKGNVIGERGPAVSLDEGRTWKWLGSEVESPVGMLSGSGDANKPIPTGGPAFRYTFPADVEEVRFSFGMPYMERNLQEFTGRYKGNPNLNVNVLCKTEKERNVELLHLGRLDGKCDYRVLFTCRHHACEMMANYALEGIMESVLADTDDGRWFRQHVEFLVVPFVDKDGVEDGDQGKNRIPRDHNRDYSGESIYSSVRAIREIVPKWSDGRIKAAFDLHCPYIRDHALYMVGASSESLWRRQCDFGRILEAVQSGPLVYQSGDDLPFGKGWNTEANYESGMSFSSWADGLEGIEISTTFEIPYASVKGIAVTPESAKAFGHDLACALRQFLGKL